MVHENLADCKNSRERSWSTAEQHEVVPSKVPLIRSMRTRILETLPFRVTK